MPYESHRHKSKTRQLIHLTWSNFLVNAVEAMEALLEILVANPYAMVVVVTVMVAALRFAVGLVASAVLVLGTERNLGQPKPGGMR